MDSIRASNIQNILMNNRPLQQPMTQYPKVYYQMSTNNKSALQMHYFLKAKGIKKRNDEPDSLTSKIGILLFLIKG